MNENRPILLLAALLAACGPAQDRPTDGSIEADGDTAGSPHPRAAYLTSLTFVGFEATPSLVHLRFENRAERGELALSYGGWVAGRSEWAEILAVEDTIPVPRAAWRVLPTSGFRLRVGTGAQIEAVRLPVDDTPLRVEALDEISSWSSATGQRETLRSAELILGPGAESGFLLQRRRARSLDSPRADAPAQAFVLTDTIGDGLVILRNRAVADAPATVWTWLEGERLEWTDALLLALSPSDGSPGRWSLEIPGEGIVVEIEGQPPLREATAPTGSYYRLYPVRATLSTGDDRRALAGIGIEDDGP